MMTTDKQLLRNRFAANFHRYDKLAVVQNEICGQLSEMIGRNCITRIGRAMEIGAGTGFLTRRLVQLYPEARWFVNDLVQQSMLYIRDYTVNRRAEYLWGDAETLSFPPQIDLIASASVVQWFDNLPSFVARCEETLIPGGYLAFSTFGPDNFREIRETTGEGLAYYTCQQLQAILDASGFVTVETLEYTRQLRFETPTDVLHHIKATGVNSIRPVRWTKQRLADFSVKYDALFTSPEGGVTLTYHPILILGQKK